MEIPASWLDVFQRVKAVAPDAILAGGCLRDLDNGRPVKDLDIFVEVFAKPGRITKALSSTHEYDRNIGEQYLTWDSSVADVHLYKPTGDIPEVNLVFVHDCTVEKQMERFDFGICRIMFDLNLHKDWGYMKDKEDHTFTLLRNSTSEQRKHSLKRFERLQVKYPGWWLVEPHGVPEETDDFFTL